MESEIKTSYLLGVTLLVKKCLLCWPDNKICALAFGAYSGENCGPEGWSLPPKATQADLGLEFRLLTIYHGVFPRHVVSSDA